MSIIISDNFDTDRCPNPDCRHSIEGDHTMMFEDGKPPICGCDRCKCVMESER